MCVAGAALAFCGGWADASPARGERCCGYGSGGTGLASVEADGLLSGREAGRYGCTRCAACGGRGDAGPAGPPGVRDESDTPRERLRPWDRRPLSDARDAGFSARGFSAGEAETCGPSRLLRSLSSWESTDPCVLGALPRARMLIRVGAPVIEACGPESVDTRE